MRRFDRRQENAMIARERFRKGGWIVGLGVLALFTVACGGGSGSASAPSPTPVPNCAVVAAPSNPAGGGGTVAQIRIDPATYGRRDMSKLTVWGYDRIMDTNGPFDPQLAELAPDISPQVWSKWDRLGLFPGDYDFSVPARAQSLNIAFIGGMTASALFQDEPDFAQVASCDASGNWFVFTPSDARAFYRGSLASPLYRQYLVDIAKIQIDGGVDGFFFDEIDASYNGANNSGNGGLDDANTADFGGYLCAKYPNLSAAQWDSQFGVTAADQLDCTLSPDRRGRGFKYRDYLARHRWTASPLTSTNPLAREWGRNNGGGRPDPTQNSFVQTYPTLVYWQDIVLTLRTYARQKYGREILITANGIYPFADYQMAGMLAGYNDGPGGTPVNWVPVTSGGRFDGTVSWQPAFRSLKQRSFLVAGLPVPISVFQDGSIGFLEPSHYWGMSEPDREDYMRVFAAEAYSNGIYPSLMLFDWTTPTADAVGMMPFFKQLAAFYKSHETLYHGAVDSSANVSVSAAHVIANLAAIPDGRTVLHLVNHNYSRGFQPQNYVVVTFPVSHQPATVTLVSPDSAQDTPAAFTYSGGLLQVTVPQLVSYVAVVAE
jgi:hypothetical protein